MFGRHHHNHCEERWGGDRWAGGRHGGGRRGGWGGWGLGGGGRGFGGDDLFRAGRMLAQGDLRLLALALIAEKPRHGYEIIKHIEEKTGGWYSPSPGVVYPTLTYLEEAGYVAVESEGAKKLYTITEEGRAHLAESKELTDAILGRLDALGEKVEWVRRKMGFGGDGRMRGSRLVEAGLDNLREVAEQKLSADPADEARIVEILARAAGEITRGRGEA